MEVKVWATPCEGSILGSIKHNKKHKMNKMKQNKMKKQKTKGIMHSVKT